jgi:hypothetical protein
MHFSYQAFVFIPQILHEGRDSIVAQGRKRAELNAEELVRQEDVDLVNQQRLHGRSVII